MPRQKKDAKILNIKLSKEVSDMLELFCEETGMSKNNCHISFLLQKNVAVIRNIFDFISCLQPHF